MSKQYDPTALEAKWQKAWEEAGIYKTDFTNATNPYYSLVMFPYPSGDRLHIGHWYNYAPADSFARFMKMQGKDVFFPMGFDAFGLPAENYAIKTGTPPAASTEKNVETMTTQIKRIGCMIDWSKTLNTTTPDYYRWTQWLFLQMFKNDLAYKKLGNVNFCPSCQTVLANEQVWDGKCERCESVVIQKPLEQWYWKITKYADKLLDNLRELDWPEKTKLMQTNWIGRSEGAEISFETEQKIGVIPYGSPRIHSGATTDAFGPMHSGATMDAFGRIHSGAHNEPFGSRRMNSPATSRTLHLTFTPKKRANSFNVSSEATRIVSALVYAAQRHDILIHEACAMPDHVHLLVSFQAGRDLMKDIVKKLKGVSARIFLKAFEDDLHLWGEGSHYETIESEQQFTKVLQYIQDNPSTASISPEGRLLSCLSASIRVFTTRPDTLFGSTYLVLAPEHSLVKAITTSDRNGAIEKYIAAAAKKTELERKELQKTKTGEFTGAYALHPVTGEKLPIWIADYVLTNYGTGGIMAVPAHDERDHEFAKTFDLPMKEVVKGEKSEGAFTGEGETINSDFLNGLRTVEAKKKMIDWLVKNKKGKGVTNFRLRDWLVSRQRYWGAPIPIVYDPEGEPHPVPDEHLPWTLPTDVEFKPKGESPLRHSKEFKSRTEKIFGKGWTPEYDTMDTFVCSSFYYLRYLADSKKLIDPSIEKKWVPVSMYIGGPEHACMHLIYARFVMMALKDFGFVSHEEPFKKLVHQGLITSKGAKMSKSKGNVVSPDSFVEKFGSDVFRMYLMFMGPFTDGGDWSDAGIMGIVRFTDRLHRFLTEKATGNDSEGATKHLHKTIKRVTQSIAEMKFNTAISALMELLNALEKESAFSKQTAQTISLLLAPLAPHLAEELWHALGGKGFAIEQAFPTFDPSLIKDDTITIVIQVNGKLRGQIVIAADMPQEEVLKLARAEENVKKFLTGSIKKEIYVPGKLVSFVVVA